MPKANCQFFFCLYEILWSITDTMSSLAIFSFKSTFTIKKIIYWNHLIVRHDTMMSPSLSLFFVSDAPTSDNLLGHTYICLLAYLFIFLFGVSLQFDQFISAACSQSLNQCTYTRQPECQPIHRHSIEI